MQTKESHEMKIQIQGDVSTFTNLSDALCGVDFVFEAIIDNLDVKQWLYESE